MSELHGFKDTNLRKCSISYIMKIPKFKKPKSFQDKNLKEITQRKKEEF